MVSDAGLDGAQAQPPAPPAATVTPAARQARENAPDASAAARPSAAWQLLEQALRLRRPVRVGYHGHQRLLCPHAMGWKNGRAKVLAYQSGGATSNGRLPTDPHQRWRWMFIDELEGPLLTNEPWQTADNYRGHSNGIDHLAVAIDPHTHDASR